MAERASSPDDASTLAVDEAHRKALKMIRDLRFVTNV